MPKAPLPLCNPASLCSYAMVLYGVRYRIGTEIAYGAMGCAGLCNTDLRNAATLSPRACDAICHALYGTELGTELLYDDTLGYPTGLPTTLSGT
eukprot:1261262-Rhodomonas_salina.1